MHTTPPVYRERGSDRAPLSPERKQQNVEANRRYRAEHPEQERERKRVAMKAYRARYPKKVQAERVRHRYGLTTDEYNAMVEQGCAVCGTHEAIGVDHDHRTGKVRGPLCRCCNAALGMAEDSIDRLLDLANYLNGQSG